MSETKFTPGPWHVFTATDGFVSVYASGVEVWNAEKVGFALQGPRSTIAGVAHDADAHLIAAAPRMYDCILGLQGLLQLIASRPDVPAGLMALVAENHRWIEAEETLASARGEA